MSEGSACFVVLRKTRETRERTSFARPCCLLQFALCCAYSSSPLPLCRRQTDSSGGRRANSSSTPRRWLAPEQIGGTIFSLTSLSPVAILLAPKLPSIAAQLVGLGALGHGMDGQRNLG